MRSIVNGMKVIIPVSVLCGGGTELQTVQLARTLISSNCSVEVICFNEFYPTVVDMLEEYGIKVTLFREDCRKNKLSFFMRIFKVFRNSKPQVVHVQYTELGLLTLAAAWLARVPVRLATVHQMGDSYGFSQKLLMKMSLLLSTAFLFVSLAAERSWFGEGNLWLPNEIILKKHYTIYNCVDIETIEKANFTLELDSMKKKYMLTNDYVIGIVGRISRQKGHMVLLDALKLLNDKIDNFKVLVIGDELEKDLFSMKAKKMSLDNKIIYLGWLPSKELYKLYHIVDVVAIPSLNESFGLVAAEAMASGTAIVSTNVGWLTEIIDDKINKILVEPGNPIQLANAIITVLSNQKFAKELRYSGKVIANRLFSREKYSEQILSFYENITM